ncbi:hypothetical protein BCR36DRAFT_416608 [Piromyces finnis]|uniref:Coiled-coil domain-containing protein n=1 Tax=Piromyces finnis TaxID=1754191 RepID=A0A1Y1UUS7_9FUNG|nr:hypothetical protein BCR36DRAFT_407400 [Piromyces finnis]ORX41712.1 hypothetical protein BCR36DRAFT_416608 [Piromyces finnis]|eukprot:ORX41711.1 hypothetical protein BCR36DRAFT_407400 [Piromyces finnis]
MKYYGNNVFNEKSYKVAIRRSKKQKNKNKKTTSSSYMGEMENSIDNSIISFTNNNDDNDNTWSVNKNELNQKNLINIPKAYQFFKQRKIEEYKENGIVYSRSDLEKHIQRDWKNSPENPLNQYSIKENMKMTTKCSLKKINITNKKDIRKNKTKFTKYTMDY